MEIEWEYQRVSVAINAQTLIIWKNTYVEQWDIYKLVLAVLYYILLLL